MACFDIEFTHCGEVTETERLFAVIFIRCCTVEVLSCQFCRFFVITVKKSLAYVIEQMCRLLVYVPIIQCTAFGVRTATPQCLFVECDTFSLERTKYVRTDTSVAYRQRLRFPFLVGVIVPVTCPFGFLVGPIFGLSTIPYGLAVQCGRFVEPN